MQQQTQVFAAIACNSTINHGKRHLVAYDSAGTVEAAVKGRSSRSISRELQRAGTYILATDSVEGALWCESEHNLADSLSRQGPLPVPAPRRLWVHQFFEGDSEAFVDRRKGASVAWRPRTSRSALVLCAAITVGSAT